MWQWDNKWLELVNQTPIKSVWARGVHLPWVQNWPDLGDFPDWSMYHFATFHTIKSIRGSIILQRYSILDGTYLTWREILTVNDAGCIFDCGRCWHLCSSQLSSLYGVLSKKTFSFFLLLSFLFLSKHEFEYKKAPHALFFFLSCSISSGKCFVFLLKTADLSRPV